ncbi:hypothetical protein NDU88_007885, partial [Pleurodeles waltl]
PERRILPHTHPPCPQKILEIHRSRQPFSIPCPSFRTEISSQNIYQMSSTNRSLSQKEKTPSFSILRRLVDK